VSKNYNWNKTSSHSILVIIVASSIEINTSARCQLGRSWSQWSQVCTGERSHIKRGTYRKDIVAASKVSAEITWWRIWRVPGQTETGCTLLDSWKWH